MNLNNWKIQPKEVLNAGPVMPVMVIQNLDDAVPLAKALVAGGIKVLEITLRTPIALDAIRLISQEVKEAIVGAGTITTPEQLKAAEDGLKAADDRLIELSRTQVTPTNSVDLAKQIKDAKDSVKSAKEKVKQAKAFLAAAQKELSAVSTSSI